MVIARLSLKLSLNNPKHITFFAGNVPQKRQSEREGEGERERERKKKRKKERKKEREGSSSMSSDMIWQLQEIVHAPQVEFLSSALPVLRMCRTVLLGLRQVCWTVMYVPRLSLLGGPYRFTVFRAHL